MKVARQDNSVVFDEPDKAGRTWQSAEFTFKCHYVFILSCSKLPPGSRVSHDARHTGSTLFIS